MIDNRSLQRALADMGYYPAKVDGVVGPITMRAMDDALAAIGVSPALWSSKRKRVATEQLLMKHLGIETGHIDGLVGPQTVFGWEKWQNYARNLDPDDTDIEHQPNIWPRQRDARSYFGDPGTAQKQLALPFKMKLAWDTRHDVTTFFVHEKGKRGVEAALHDGSDIG